MIKHFHIFLLIISAISMALADVCLQKIQKKKPLKYVFIDPLFFTALFLYGFQILTLAYMIVSGEAAEYISLIQMLIYVLVVVCMDIFLFKGESSYHTLIGIIISICGVMLMYY